MSGLQWDPMQYPGVGGRYYFFPMLAWFMGLMVVAGRETRYVLRWAARGLLVCCAIGVVCDWGYTPYPRTGFRDVAKIFDRAAPGTVMTFPGNPPSWGFSLAKRRSRW
jgi:hypothetical protein